MSLPYTGFVPGQTVPVLAEIDNISNVRIDYVTFSFKKVMNSFNTHLSCVLIYYVLESCILCQSAKV